MSLLSSFFSALRSKAGALSDAIKTSSTENLVSLCLTPVKNEFPHMFEDACGYVLNGDNEQVLLQALHANPSNAINKYGTACSSYQYLRPLAATQIKARASLLNEVAQNKIEMVVCIRLAKFLSELLNQDIEKHTPYDFPSWLHFLLNDLLAVTQKGTQGYNHQPFIVSASFYEDICKVAALPKAYWLNHFFHRNLANDGWHNYLTKISEYYCTNILMSDYIIDNKDFILSDIYPNLGAFGKNQFLTEISKAKLVSEFKEQIIELCVDKNKTTRESAGALLTKLDAKYVNLSLSNLLIEGNATQRKETANLLSKFDAKEAVSLLSAAAKKEKSKSVLAHLNLLMGTLGPAPKEQVKIQWPVYQQLDMQNKVSEEVVDIIFAEIELQKKKIKNIKPESTWQKDDFRVINGRTKRDAQKVVDALNGIGKKSDGMHGWRAYVDWNKVLAHPSVKPFNLITYDLSNVYRRNEGKTLQGGIFIEWLSKQKNCEIDLRAIDDAISTYVGEQNQICDIIIRHYWGPIPFLSKVCSDKQWPYFYQKLDYLLQRLDAKSSNYSYADESRNIIKIFDSLPKLPESVQQRLLIIALGNAKTNRTEVQALLLRVPNIHIKVINALKSTQQDVRFNAAKWLGQIGNRDAEKWLKEALKVEKREAVQASIIKALQSIGVDISKLLTPSKLLKEAQAGLKKKMPASLSWFPFDALPEAKWKSNRKVDPDIIKWWIVLACKLKEPRGDGIHQNYLALLDANSAKTLSLYILKAFIHQDTISHDYETATESAVKEAPQRFSMMQNWAKQTWGAEYKNKTLEDAIEDIRREYMSLYLGSAIKDKGILTLCSAASGNEVLTLLKQFMKDHYTRRAQIESMLNAMFVSEDPLVIQFILATSRRYRTTSVQTLARQLIEEIAKRNNWTKDQLADRTMPTAGFDENAELILDYGQRQFTLRIDSKLKPVLFNADNKVIKALPAPRQSEDATLVKEAKSTLSASKKELKQVLTLTLSRFYEAMCSQRQWPYDEWLEFIYAHPIANRICQQIVWQHNNKDRTQSFRIVEDGVLISHEDDEIALPTSGTINIAHVTGLGDNLAKAWKAHLKDYKVTSLFNQFETAMSLSQLDLKANTIDNFKGFISDSFTIRSVLTKQGYQRGQAEDAGFFYTYVKEFSSLNLCATIVFSGNCLPEENVVAALDCLCFTDSKTGNVSYYNDGAALTLDQLPVILLNEVMRDYEFMASKTAGFDPDWEKKVPW